MRLASILQTMLKALSIFLGLSVVAGTPLQHQQQGQNAPLIPKAQVGNCPGCVIDTLDYNTISEALNQLLDDASWLLDRRACAMAISNNGTYTYTNLQYWLDEGSVEGFLPPHIEPGQTGLFLFTSEFFSITGTGGVLSLDIATNPSFLVSVMWSITSTIILYDDWHNFKVYPHSQITSPNKEMFNQLYYHAAPFPEEKHCERSEFGVSMAGEMSRGDHVKYTVTLDNSGFNPMEGPSYHIECDNKFLFNKKCRRECSPFGRCWTSHKCDEDKDCNPNLICDTACE